jgi:uncharacterized protein
MSSYKYRTIDWEFDWDPEKAKTNFAKHGVTFLEAASCFLDPHGQDGVDATEPNRETLIAYSDQERLLLTVYVEAKFSESGIRIISARKATREERARYERAELKEMDEDGWHWRQNPYAESIARTGIVVRASALPPGARTRQDWLNRRSR